MQWNGSLMQVRRARDLDKPLGGSLPSRPRVPRDSGAEEPNLERDGAFGPARMRKLEQRQGRGIRCSILIFQ